MTSPPAQASFAKSISLEDELELDSGGQGSAESAEDYLALMVRGPAPGIAMAAAVLAIAAGFGYNFGLCVLRCPETVVLGWLQATNPSNTLIACCCCCPAAAAAACPLTPGVTPPQTSGASPTTGTADQEGLHLCRELPPHHQGGASLRRCARGRAPGNLQSACRRRPAFLRHARPGAQQAEELKAQPSSLR